MFEPKLERSINDGVQRIYVFPNGFGASVVKHSFSYGRQTGSWELAVLKFNSDNPLDFKLRYDTPITDDVLGHLSEVDVQQKLQLISELEESA